MSDSVPPSSSTPSEPPTPEWEPAPERTAPVLPLPAELGPLEPATSSPTESAVSVAPPVEAASASTKESPVIASAPAKPAPASTIHLIGGEKGGVGKSLVSRIVTQYLLDRALPFRAFDTDRSHGALLRFYPSVSSPMLVDRYDHLDRILETANEHPGERILVDLAAQTHDPLVKWMDEVGMIEMAAELGFSVRYWHVMDAGKDSVDLLRKLLDRFGSSLQYILVLNQVRGESFDIFDRSGERERAIALGAQFISVRRLLDHVINKIDASNAAFLFAKNPENDLTGLGLVDRQRVKIWLTHVYAQIDNVGI